MKLLVGMLLAMLAITGCNGESGSQNNIDRRQDKAIEKLTKDIEDLIDNTAKKIRELCKEPEEEKVFKELGRLLADFSSKYFEKKISIPKEGYNEKEIKKTIRELITEGRKSMSEEAKRDKLLKTIRNTQNRQRIILKELPIILQALPPDEAQKPIQNVLQIQIALHEIFIKLTE